MFEGVWRSKAGAELRLLQNGEAISGTYTAAGSGIPQTFRSRMLVGTAEGDIIGFVTSTSVPLQITTWTGRLVRVDHAASEELHTVFHAVEQCSDQRGVKGDVTLETAVFSKITDLELRQPPASL